MKRRDFVKLTQKANLRPDLSKPEEYDSLMGLALHQERRMVSEGGAIAFIRYQAMQFNGLLDMAELENLQWCFKRVDIV